MTYPYIVCHSKTVSHEYEEYVLNVGDFDERIFLGEDASTEIGTPAKMCPAVAGDLTEKMQVSKNLWQSYDEVCSAWGGHVIGCDLFVPKTLTSAVGMLGLRIVLRCVLFVCVYLVFSKRSLCVIDATFYENFPLFTAICIWFARGCVLIYVHMIHLLLV